MVEPWHLLFSKQAQKDSRNLKSARLQEKAEELLSILSVDPFQNPPHFKKMVGEMEGYYSRRINLQHRLVYQVDEKTREVLIFRMWTHYE